jgi:hypothetical protein
MGTTTNTSFVPADATPDPVTPPTTSYLARTTSYPGVLAGYMELISRLSTSRDLPTFLATRTKPARRSTTPGRQRSHPSLRPR